MIVSILSVLIFGTVTSLVAWGLITAFGIEGYEPPLWFWVLIPTVSFGSAISYQVYEIHKLSKEKKNTSVAKSNEGSK